jgi:hypothetical protein
VGRHLTYLPETLTDWTYPKVITLWANPLTNSDSASAKSIGALLVSARAPIKKIINTGNKGTINQIGF